MARTGSGSNVWLAFGLGWVISGCAAGSDAPGAPFTGAEDVDADDSDTVTPCGNGKIDPGEDCDGELLDGATCQTLDHEGGELYCNTDCTYDEIECFSCGDEIKNGDEECDDQDFGDETCSDLGFDGDGYLTCTDECKIETETCGYECGNGTIDETEHCDGADVDGYTCQDLGYEDGTLLCDPNDCVFDVSGCYNLACKAPGEACTDASECCAAASGSSVCDGVCQA